MTTPKRILIIEDENEVAILMEARLKAKGYEVLRAADGLEGLDTARREKPDLIILDVMIPKKDGFQVCRMLKFDPAYQAIPIILLTARGQLSDQKIGQEIRADAYLSKPFDAAAMLKKVEELLERQ